jgi:hypothetical protein
MAKKILIAIAILGVGLTVLISLQPGTFSVQRSAVVAAPPAAVFALVNDLAAWDAWSPWKKLDPNPKTTISTPSAGKGATFTWSGNDAIGEGSLTIVDSRPDEMVEAEQAFVRPFEGKARLVFTFAPDAGGTMVTWTMEGTNNFVGKAMCLVMDMDAMLGKDFEQGLANIKAMVQKGGAT